MRGEYSVAKNWLTGGDQASIAADQILDAAGRCFLEFGVGKTTIGHIASEANCSRMTIYRYFDDRDALRTAFAHREAQRIGTDVAAAVRCIRNPAKRLIDAVMLAVTMVRENPAQSAWFSGEDLQIGRDFAMSSEVIGAMIRAFLHDESAEARERAQYLSRIILSLLIVPGDTAEDERRLLERFVVPIVLSQGARA